MEEEEIDLQFMEDLGITLGSIQELGCNASFEEFEAWYNQNIEAIESTEIVIENQEPEAVSIADMYVVYEDNCFGQSVVIEPETFVEKEKESNKLGMYAVGAAILYFLFKKK